MAHFTMSKTGFTIQLVLVALIAVLSGLNTFGLFKEDAESDESEDDTVNLSTEKVLNWIVFGGSLIATIWTVIQLMNVKA